MKAIMDAFEAMPYLTVREANNIQQYQDDGDWDFWEYARTEFGLSMKKYYYLKWDIKRTFDECDRLMAEEK